MYEQVFIYDSDGNFIGYSIKDPNARKLQTTNIYLGSEEKDLYEQLDRLNNKQQIMSNWPDAKDPDVVALLNDPNFSPIEMIETDVVDDDNSYYVYVKDGNGEDVIDQQASVLSYKKMMVPARPTDVMQRVKLACEEIAKRRMR